MEKQMALTTGMYKNVLDKSLNMKKSCLLSKTTGVIISKLTNLIKGMKMNLQSPSLLLSQYYSKVLEKEITLKQANAITEAQIAFLVFIFPADYSLILRACIGVWVYLALNKCKKRLS